ncbi:MAG: hypothetical protein EOM20_09500 [Spartobacteria bacterium]|nr:hypothetical protein [Spartobacteria bacterium]
MTDPAIRGAGPTHEPQERSRAWKTLILSSGKMAASGMAILTAMVLARVLSKVELAAYNQTLLVYQALMPLLLLGLPNALYFFLSGHPAHPRRMLFENLLPLLVMGLGFFLFLILGGNRLIAARFGNPLLVRTLLIFSPYALLMLPMESITPCLTARNQVGKLALFNVGSRLLLFGMAASAAWLFGLAEAAVTGVTLAAVLVGAGAFILMWRACPGPVGVVRLKPVLAMVRMGLPLGLGAMLLSLAFALDKVLVSVMCLPDQFAVYSLGAIEIPFIGIITFSAITVITPEMTVEVREGRTGAAFGLWKQTMLKCAVLLLPFMGLLLALAPQIATLMYSREYLGSAVPLRIYALLLPLRTTGFAMPFMTLNRPRTVVAGGALMLVCNALLSVTLVSHFGPNGAAWGTVISYWLLATFYVTRLSRVTTIPLSRLVAWREMGHILLGVLAVAGITVLLYLPLSDYPVAGLFACGALYMAMIGGFYHVAHIATWEDIRSVWRKT